MWYGSKTTSNLNRQSRNSMHRLHCRDQKLGKVLQKRRTEPHLFSHIHLPMGWEFVALSPKQTTSNTCTVYLYRTHYFLNFTLPPHLKFYSFDTQTRTFSLSLPHTSYCYFYYLKTLNDLFSRFLRPYFLKIRFQGKGYYMYKNKRNTIAPQFGYAHRVYVYAQSTSVKFLSKTKILLFGLSRNDIVISGHNIKGIKPINVFTGRGIRFARQVIYKKTGKVSSYR